MMCFKTILNMFILGVILIFSTLINCQPLTDLPGNDNFLWNSNNYPHPWIQPSRCGHLLPSFICDPDGLLTNEQISLINDKLWINNSKGKCICKSCKIGRKNLPTAIAIISSSKVPDEDKNLRQFVDDLRLQWKYGDCENDVIILVTNQKASLSIGKSALELLKSSQMLNKLIDDSKNFHNGSIFEYLNSTIDDIIESSKSLKIDQIGPFPNSIVHSPSDRLTYSSSNRLNNGQIKDAKLTSNKTDLMYESPRNRPLITKLPNLTSSQAVNPSQSQPFMIASQYDDMNISQRKKYLNQAIIVTSIITCLLLLLIIIFSLILWYQKTRTGNTGFFGKKKATETNNGKSIEATKYELCKQLDDQ